MNNIPCILIPALVGLISGILGYLIGKMSGNSGDNNSHLSLQSDLDACRANTKMLHAKITSLETDLAHSKNKISTVSQSFVATAATIPYDANASYVILGKKYKQDDLKIVEGIGPKIEELYHEAGIKTWLALSQTSTEKSQNILDGGGERYSVHNPSTWAKQAEMAYLGKWQELKDWQYSLDGGKE